ncbi:MAG: hypothetical protein M3082_14800 [Candidatus Dormibacteraeota bacterium]|nr:hypothetical protein [Candidatus Dormibacteraeota bacterium]
MTARWLALLVALGALLLTAATPAQASCGVFSRPLPTTRDEVNAAKVVFVGKVVYTSDQNRSARVRVESIWKGPSLPAYIDVHGEAPGSGPFSGSEGDHQYQAGQQYLFFPLNDHPPFQDYGDCNASTQVYSAALAAYAPADAKAPNPAAPSDMIWNFVDEYTLPRTIAALLVVALASLVLVKRHRRARLLREFDI